MAALRAPRPGRGGRDCYSQSGAEAAATERKVEELRTGLESECMRRILLDNKSWQLPAAPSVTVQRLQAAPSSLSGQPARSVPCAGTQLTTPAPCSAAQAAPVAAPASAPSHGGSPARQPASNGWSAGSGATSLRELVLEEEVLFLRQQLHDREEAFRLEKRRLLATVRDLRASLRDARRASTVSPAPSPLVARPGPGPSSALARPPAAADNGADGGYPIRWAELVTTLLGACALELAKLALCVEATGRDGAEGAEGAEGLRVPEPEIVQVQEVSACSGHPSACPGDAVHARCSHAAPSGCSHGCDGARFPAAPRPTCTTDAARGPALSKPAPACYTGPGSAAGGGALSPGATATHKQLASPHGGSHGGSHGRRAEPLRSRPMLRRWLGDGLRNETAVGAGLCGCSEHSHRDVTSACAAREGCGSPQPPPSAWRDSVPGATASVRSARLDGAVAVAEVTETLAREARTGASPIEAFQRAQAGSPEDGFLALEQEMDLLIGAMRDESRGLTERWEGADRRSRVLFTS